jgi:hypothetical protein
VISLDLESKLNDARKNSTCRRKKRNAGILVGMSIAPGPDLDCAARYQPGGRLARRRGDSAAFTAAKSPCQDALLESVFDARGTLM